MADIHCHGSAQNCHLKSAESEPVTTIHIANCSQQKKKKIMLKLKLPIITLQLFQELVYYNNYNVQAAV